MTNGYWSAASTGTVIRQLSTGKPVLLSIIPGVARYFREVFDDDWNPMANMAKPKTDYVKIAIVALVIVLLLVIYFRRHRT